MPNNSNKKSNAITGAKKGSKQGSLFSFFSKKEKQPKDTEPLQKQSVLSLQPPQKNAYISASNPTKLSQQTSQHVPHRLAPQSSSSGKILSNQLKIGDSIEVFWADDDEWYEAKVMKQKGTTSTYFIQYSIDGQSEWIDLSTESFHLLTDNTKESKKRSISAVHDDNDDGSDENEYVPSSSDDEVESAFNEDDQWMVTDDEDEVAPKKKQKSSSNLAAGAIDCKTQRKPSHAVKKSSSTTPSLTHYAAPMTVTQHSFDRNGKISPSTSQTTPKHISPMTTANGDLSAKSSTTICSTSTAVQNSGGNNVATPLAIAKSLLKTPKMKESPPKALNFDKGALNPAGSHVHNHLPFLQNPRDSHGRTPDDPNYDSRTIQIQERDWIRIVEKKMTDAVKQWWDLKAMYFDTVLLFKTGKYQLQKNIYLVLRSVL